MNGNPDAYNARMHRVLAHIDSQIDGPLTLAELAQVAHFSDFHFHRLFAAWSGERVGDYVRRRRLEIAATRLLTQPRSSVISIALSVGFSSGEAFARSFKLRFGLTPGAWRRERMHDRMQDRNLGQPDSKFDQEEQGPGLQHAGSNPLPEFAMNQAPKLPSRAPAASHSELHTKVHLENLPSTDLAYLRHVGPYGTDIGHFWATEVADWLRANGLERHTRYGISHDDPGVVDAARCRYDACVEAPADLVLSGPAQRMRLPGGRYAMLDFEGDPSTIGDAWTALLRDWLPGSGLQMDNRPCFELYPAASASTIVTTAISQARFACQICIPVAPL